MAAAIDALIKFFDKAATSSPPTARLPVTRAPAPPPAPEFAPFDRDRFIAEVSHALRTPLNALIGFSDILARPEAGSLTTHQARALNEVRKAAAALSGVVDRGLSLAEDPAQPASPALSERLDPRVIVLSALDAVRLLAEQKGVTLYLPPAASGLGVKADAARLRQVLLHLLDNAVRHNRPGGAVVIQVGQTDGQVRIVMRDTGPGLPPTRVADPFAPGRRADGRLAVGLASALRLARSMGGDLTMESRKGEGCCVTLTLPAADEAPPRAAPLDGRVVLYMDDHPANGALMRHVMAGLGPRLHVVESGEAGLALARDLGPDVILLDIHLPDLDGFEIKARLDADAATRDIPVVALTAGAGPGDPRRALRAGFAGWLTKPLDVPRLAETLSAIVPTR